MSNASLGRPANTAVDKLRTDALATMDLTKIVRAYIGTLIDSASGYKAIILDKDTMRVASTLYGRSEFAEHNVVHVEKLEDQETNKEHTELKVSAVGMGQVTTPVCPLPSGAFHVASERSAPVFACVPSDVHLWQASA